MSHRPDRVGLVLYYIQERSTPHPTFRVFPVKQKEFCLYEESIRSIKDIPQRFCKRNTKIDCFFRSNLSKNQAEKSKAQNVKTSNRFFANNFSVLDLCLIKISLPEAEIHCAFGNV